MKTRLNKYLSECGFGSRRNVEEFILDARVEINKNTVIDLATVIDEDKDEVRLDGEIIKKKQKEYILLYKPKGYISSTKDDKGRKTVLDLVKTKNRVFPVGRLDYDTTGVLILTNDGEFTNKMTHPSNGIVREYVAKLDKPLTEEDRIKLTKGVYVGKRKSKFVFAKIRRSTEIVIGSLEGRYHFVKNMFLALGYDVKKLERSKFGEITLEGMNPGEYRHLTKSEIENVYKKTN